jgi:N-acetylglutamate synthase-like GNAT family acetyltransferase
LFNLRPAVSNDAQAIRALIRQVGNNPIGLNWRRFIVAVDAQDQVIGCGQIKPHGDGSHELASIAVRPEWQNQGIGQAIIEQLLSEGPRPLYLTCRASLEGYYQKYGFVVTTPDEMPPYFRRIYQAFSFVRRLLPFFRERLLVMRTARP